MVASCMPQNPPEISPKAQTGVENFETEAKRAKLIENGGNRNVELGANGGTVQKKSKKMPITPSDTEEDEAMLVAAEILEAAKLKTSALNSNSTNGAPNSTGSSTRLDKPILESQKRQFLEWMRENGNNLYPTRQDKERLAEYLKASYIQVTRLLANHRRRTLKYKRVNKNLSEASGSPQENKENAQIVPNLEEASTEDLQMPQSPSNVSMQSMESSVFQTPVNPRKRQHETTTATTTTTTIAESPEAERERKIDETIMDIWNKVTCRTTTTTTDANSTTANGSSNTSSLTDEPKNELLDVKKLEAKMDISRPTDGHPLSKGRFIEFSSFFKKILKKFLAL